MRYPLYGGKKCNMQLPLSLHPSRCDRHKRVLKSKKALQQFLTGLKGYISTFSQNGHLGLHPRHNLLFQIQNQISVKKHPYNP